LDGSTTISRFAQPALIGGLVAGVLSALPIINLFNACCCLWVVSGGVVAAYLLQDREPSPIQVGDGALVGLMAGVIGAFVNLVLLIPVTLLLAPMQRAMMEQLIDNGNLPPEMREMLSSGFGTALGIVATFFLTLFAGLVFSTLGGVLGAVIFRKKTAPPPPVIDIPPSQM
jgi:uncharacterized protein YqgC (DUF456 family)